MLKDLRKIDTLSGWSKNPRGVDKSDLERLKIQLKKYGQYKPLLINKDGIVLGGNMRLKAMLDMGIKDVWVSEVDAQTEQRMVEYALSDNDRIGHYDDELLAELVASVPDIDLGEFKVDLGKPVSIEQLLQQFAPEPVEDEAPELDEGEAVSKLGEIYQLGRHRVMCGDSTKIEDVERLMDGKKADMVFTDPPYGVNYSGRGENTSNVIENDNLTVEETGTLARESLTNAFVLSNEGATCFVWHADSKLGLRPAFEEAFTMSGWRLAATIIWVKKQASMGYQDYRSQHEPCLYGWKGTKSERVTDRTQTTIWETGRDSNYEHPTQKPIFLASTAIKNHNPNLVMDLFLGSGSTLIACEQTNRTCYGMELDPKYVDVIRKRYAKFIGQEDKWEEITAMKPL